MELLYLYLTQSIYLDFDIEGKNFKRAGVDIIKERFLPKLRRFRDFITASIKSMRTGRDLDPLCLSFLNVSSEDHMKYLAREGIEEKEFRLGEKEEEDEEEEEEKKNCSLKEVNVVTKGYVDCLKKDDKKPKKFVYF